jgi:hypothetical protein
VQDPSPYYSLLFYFWQLVTRQSPCTGTIATIVFMRPFARLLHTAQASGQNCSSQILAGTTQGMRWAWISSPPFEPQNVEYRMMNFEVLSQLLRFDIRYSTFDISENAGKRHNPVYVKQMLPHRQSRWISRWISRKNQRNAVGVDFSKPLPPI